MARYRRSYANFHLTAYLELKNFSFSVCMSLDVCLPICYSYCATVLQFNIADRPVQAIYAVTAVSISQLSFRRQIGNQNLITLAYNGE